MDNEPIIVENEKDTVVVEPGTAEPETNTAEANSVEASTTEVNTVEAEANTTQAVDIAAASNTQSNTAAEQKQNSSLCLAGFIVAIVSFFINPCYVTLIAAYVLCGMGMSQRPYPANRDLAKAGLILCIFATVLQIVIDICTLGAGVFC